MYNFFVNIHRQPPTKSQLKYADLCNIDARDFDWSKRYLLLNSCTIENKLRTLQTKINLRAFVTNKKLFTIGILTAPTCTFCDDAEESVFHLFASCRQLQTFWDEVVDYVLYYSPSLRGVPAAAKLFGVDEIQCTNYVFVNCLLLCARFTIHKCRVSNCTPNFNDFLTVMREIYTTEYMAAKAKNKLMFHKKKWINFT